MYYIYCNANNQRLFDWNPTQVRIADLFLETVIAKSNLIILSLNVMDFFQAFFSLLF